MNLPHLIRDIAGGTQPPRDLPEGEAHDLFAAMLDGGVPDLELGALVIALRSKSEATSELIGFHRAMSCRSYPLHAPDGGLKPLVFASYYGAREEPNLLPLVALILQRLGIPVLLHGTLEGAGRIATAYILRELGILPCASLSQAQKVLQDSLLAFVPTATVCPGLANLLALRNRLGVRGCAHTMASLLNPFAPGESVAVVGAPTGASLETLAQFLLQSGSQALLLTATDGEAFASPRQRPRIAYYVDGRQFILFEEEAGASRGPINLPESVDAAATATWIRLAMAGEAPIPYPIVNQLACCLFAAGYTDDFNQAKAIAAVEAGGVSGRTRRMAPGLRQ